MTGPLNAQVFRLYRNHKGLAARPESPTTPSVFVAAGSVRQAFVLARRGVRLNPAAAHPVGIAATFTPAERPAWVLWCGCRVGRSTLAHGAGLAAVRVLAREHAPACPLARQAGIDPVHRLFPDATVCAACGDDLLTAAGLTVRCRPWHARYGGGTR